MVHIPEAITLNEISGRMHAGSSHREWGAELSSTTSPPPLSSFPPDSLIPVLSLLTFSFPPSCPSPPSPHFPSLTRLLASLLPHASSALDRGMRDSTGGWPSGTASSPKISLSFLSRVSPVAHCQPSPLDSSIDC